MLSFFDTAHAADNRLIRLGYGAASPLWAPFLLAAGMGVGFWALTQWTRRSLAAEISGAPAGLQPTAAPRSVDEAAHVPQPTGQEKPAEVFGDIEEPGGKAALLAETSAAVIGETASFGDSRVEDGAAGPLADPVDADEIVGAEAQAPSAEPVDDGADLIDAAYAQNFGPVPAPAVKPRSRKRKTPPGVAPEA